MASPQRILNSYMQLCSNLQAEVIRLNAENADLEEQNEKLTKQIRQLQNGSEVPT